jgi:hypothetical protein
LGHPVARDRLKNLHKHITSKNTRSIESPGPRHNSTLTEFFIISHFDIAVQDRAVVVITTSPSGEAVLLTYSQIYMYCVIDREDTGREVLDLDGLRLKYPAAARQIYRVLRQRAGCMAVPVPRSP